MAKQPERDTIQDMKEKLCSTIKWNNNLIDSVQSHGLQDGHINSTVDLIDYFICEPHKFSALCLILLECDYEDLVRQLIEEIGKKHCKRATSKTLVSLKETIQKSMAEELVKKLRNQNVSPRDLVQIMGPLKNSFSSLPKQVQGDICTQLNTLLIDKTELPHKPSEEMARQCDELIRNSTEKMLQNFNVYVSQCVFGDKTAVKVVPRKNYQELEQLSQDLLIWTDNFLGRRLSVAEFVQKVGAVDAHSQTTAKLCSAIGKLLSALDTSMETIAFDSSAPVVDIIESAQQQIQARQEDYKDVRYFEVTVVTNEISSLLSQLKEAQVTLDKKMAELQSIAANYLRQEKALREQNDHITEQRNYAQHCRDEIESLEKELRQCNKNIEYYVDQLEQQENRKQTAIHNNDEDDEQCAANLIKTFREEKHNIQKSKDKLHHKLSRKKNELRLCQEKLDEDAKTTEQMADLRNKLWDNVTKNHEPAEAWPEIPTSLSRLPYQEGEGEIEVEIPDPTTSHERLEIPPANYDETVTIDRLSRCSTSISVTPSDNPQYFL